MRTTVTLDPDTAALIRHRMRERGISFKQALNEAIRAGADENRGAPFRTATASLGVPVIDGHEFVGIVAQADVARALDDPSVGDLIEALSVGD